MSIVRRVAKNTAFLAGAEIIHKILFFFLIIYATNVLGAVNFGRYSFAFAFAFLFSIFADLGLTLIVQREVARNKSLAGKYIGTIIVLKGLFISILVVLITILLLVIGYRSEYFIVILIACTSIFLDSVSTSIRSLFISYEIMEYDAALKIFQVVVTVALGFYVLAQGWGLLAFVTVFLMVSIILLIFSVVLVRRFIRLDIKVDVELWKILLKKALPVSVAAVFGVIYFRTDTLMLSWIVGDVSVGIYNAAFQIIGALLFIPGVFCTALLPLLSVHFHESKRAFNRILRLALKYLFAIALPIAVGISLLSWRIVSFLYTAEYAKSALALQIIVWGGFFLFFGYLFYNTLVAMNLEKKIMRIAGSGAVINVVLNLLLIPYFDYVGAAVATVATQLLMIFIYIRTIRKKGMELGIMAAVVKPVIAVSVMALFVLKFMHMNLFVIIPLGAIIYFAVFLLIKGLSKEDVILIKEVVFKKI